MTKMDRKRYNDMWVIFSAAINNIGKINKYYWNL